jgi:hypothetical protein
VPRLTYANVVATLALFLALTGGAVYAANKIGSKDIERGAVKAKHVKKDAIRAKHLKADSVAAAELAADAVGPDEVAASAIGSSEIADGAVGGAEVDEAGLGQVPSAADADSVGGVKVTPFAQSQPFNSGVTETLMSVDGSKFTWQCAATAPGYLIEAPSSAILVEQRFAGNAETFRLGPGGAIGHGATSAWAFTITVHGADDTVTILEVSAFAADNNNGGTDDCFVSGELREFG